MCGDACAEGGEVRRQKRLPFLNAALLPEACKSWWRWRYDGLLVRYVGWLCRKRWDGRRFFAMFCMLLWWLNGRDHWLLTHCHGRGMRVHL